MEFLLEGLDEDKLTWTDKVDYDLYKSRKLYLNEVISPYTFNNIVPFIEHINLLDDESGVKNRQPIELVINSGGGSFHDGISIITAIKRSKTPVHSLVYSYAFSMGLAIAQACDNRYMGKLASLLFHEVMTEADGNGTQIKRTNDELDRIQKIYDDLITGKSKVTQEMLDEQKGKVNDWVIDYEKATKLGLIEGAVEDLD